MFKTKRKKQEGQSGYDWLEKRKTATVWVENPEINRPLEIYRSR
jgi:hypothetical protein